jgi:hypothetical protein
MGLDVVQLVMNVEERYGFTIPDSDAREMRSVGDLHTYILEHAEPRPDADKSWIWLRDMIASDFGISIDRITREAWVVRDLGIN